MLASTVQFSSYERPPPHTPTPDPTTPTPGEQMSGTPRDGPHEKPDPAHPTTGNTHQQRRSAGPRSLRTQQRARPPPPPNRPVPTPATPPKRDMDPSCTRTDRETVRHRTDVPPSSTPSGTHARSRALHPTPQERGRASDAP